MLRAECVRRPAFGYALDRPMTSPSRSVDSSYSDGSQSMQPLPSFMGGPSAEGPQQGSQQLDDSNSESDGPPSLVGSSSECSDIAPTLFDSDLDDDDEFRNTMRRRIRSPPDSPASSTGSTGTILPPGYLPFDPNGSWYVGTTPNDVIHRGSFYRLFIFELNENGGLRTTTDDAPTKNDASDSDSATTLRLARAYDIRG